jgi:predicted membrane-bound spermidine synthase
VPSILSLAFFISGAAALVFEIVWIDRCALVFGSSVWSASVVMSSFMAGLALGNVIAPRVVRTAGSLRAYAALEIAGAISGSLLTVLLPHLPTLLAPALRPLTDTLWLANLVRFSIAFCLMAVPATAIGATFPVVVDGLTRTDSRRFGSVLGRFYGFNTLGAVAGVLSAEIVLIPTLGIGGAARMAAGGQLIAAALAMLVAQRTITGAPTPNELIPRSDAPRPSSPLVAGAFLAGGILMASEVIWFRFLSLFVLNSTLAISIMLAVVLAAMGLGGLLASSWLSRSPRAVVYLPIVATAAVYALIASYVAFQFLTHGSEVAEWYYVLWFSAALTFWPSLLSGVMFTLTGAALNRHLPGAGRTAALLTLANTTGAMCGPLIASFVLLPAIGMERAFAVLAAGYVAVAVLTSRSAAVAVEHRVARRPAMVVAAGVLPLMAFPFGLMDRAYFRRAAEPYTFDGSRIVATREGPSETIFLMEQSWLGQTTYHRLVTNGFSMSGTHLSGSRYMRAFAYWPLLLHQAPLRKALVICYGVGVTTGAVTDVSSLESVDVVELSKDIVAISDRIYPVERHPLRDPRVKLHVEDGRQFLQHTEETFDLITGEPPPPLTPATVNLYTREYFQLVHDRLAEGGLATYWLPVPRRNEYRVAPIIRAFCDAFVDCSLWNGTPFDWMLVGTRRAAGPISDSQFASAWDDKRIGPHLREVGYEQPEQIGATFLGDAAYLNALTRDTLPLTDDFPRRLVSSRPVAHTGQPSGALIDVPGGTFAEIIDPSRASAAFQQSAWVRRLWPEDLVVRTVPFFAEQHVITRLRIEGSSPLRHIGELDALLTQTRLRRLPLWAHGSNDVLQRIADVDEEGTSGMTVYALGQRLLAARQYRAAASYLREAQRRGFQPGPARALEVYALCLVGDLDAARARLPMTVSGDRDERIFWRWMGARFGVASDG